MKITILKEKFLSYTTLTIQFYIFIGFIKSIEAFWKNRTR